MRLSADVQKTADAPDALAAIARSVFSPMECQTIQCVRVFL